MPLYLASRYTPTTLSSPSPPPAPPPRLLSPFPIPRTLPHISHARNKNKPLLRASQSVPPSPSPSSKVLPQTAIQRIAEKLRSLGYIESDSQEPPSVGPGTAGEVFIPTHRELLRRRVGHTLDPSWSSPDSPVPAPGSGTAIARFQELKVEVERQKRNGPPSEEVPMVAELVLSSAELKRLRGIGIRLTKKLKVGKAGITEGIVNGIHERWRHTELVKIKCEDLCRMNMKRTHEMLERKTGGLVIWRSGSTIILYRGEDYEYPYFSDGQSNNSNKVSISSSEGYLSCDQEENPLNIDTKTSLSLNTPAQPLLVRGVGSPQKLRFKLPGEAELEEQSDNLLEGLGPRFTDWWDYGPLPVDADMLPANVPGYRRPFRLLPFGVKPKLTNQEMTILRRLSRSVPCHFALGRNRNLQGLAASMVKLWEKCEVAKIAVKRGARNTNSDMMAEELKQLTGGILLSRDKDFIVFYRGKDFLPLAVSSAIEERRNNIMHNKDLGINNASHNTTRCEVESDSVGSSYDDQHEVSSPDADSKVKQVESSIKSMNSKLTQVLEKKMKAEKLLAELEKSVESSERVVDKEAISEEERYMLRKVGLRMKPFLLLGRRGAFDGTVENMHLHWKYRELVKIISNNRSQEDVHITARTLEASSGGILVAVERVNKGYAIIIYRGKNYRRPTQLRPKTLLTKKEAHQRYLESQRSESLKLHVLKLSQEVKHIKAKLVNCDPQTSAKHTDGFEIDSDILDSSPMSDEQINEKDGNLICYVGHLNHMNENEFTDVPSDDFEPEAKPVRDMVISKNDEEAHLDGNSYKSEEWNANPTRQTEELPFAIDHQQCSGSPRNDDETYLEGYSSKSEEEDANCTRQTDEELSSAIDHQECSGSPRQKRVSPISMGACHIPNNEALPQIESGDREIKHKVGSDVDKSFKSVSLSNKERLILRKQALKMKYKPVLAVGRNNVVAGVAKTIKTHFRKYPLAVVNIKGIAKGTSVQEVVSKLERATGSVLVSREPSKVILYRGWGSVEPVAGRKNKVVCAEKPSLTNEELSPELLNAIRIESGLPTTGVNEGP